MPTSVTLSGFKEFREKLNNLPKELFSEIGGEVKYAAETWAGLAKRDAPKDQGFLAGNIDAAQVSVMRWDTTSHSEYSAYMEWGTKSRVKIPADLQGYASQFRGGGQPGAKKAIFAWMNRVGVPKEYQWPTFLSIIIKGVHPHPYFFIQIPVVQSQLFTNVQNILKTEH